MQAFAVFSGAMASDDAHTAIAPDAAEHKTVATDRLILPSPSTGDVVTLASRRATAVLTASGAGRVTTYDPR
jgi:hypothetical protein